MTAKDRLADTGFDHLTITWVPINDLPDALVNPKGHDLEAIVASMRQFGITEPPLLDERTGRLLAGHGRRDALLLMKVRGEDPPVGVRNINGDWTVPVVRGFATQTDEEAQAYVVASNRLTEKGGWINELLADVLRNTPEDLLAVTGYSARQRDDLLALMSPPLDLDDLAAKVGEPGDRDLWPYIRVQVSPGTKARWDEMVASLPVDDEARVVWLLDHAEMTRLDAE